MIANPDSMVNKVCIMVMSVLPVGFPSSELMSACGPLCFQVYLLNALIAHIPQKNVGTVTPFMSHRWIVITTLWRMHQLVF